MNPVWSDCEKWWMDLLKSAIIIAAGALISYLFIFKWQTEYNIKQQSINDFEKHSKIFSFKAYDAIKEVSCSKHRDSSSIIRYWEDDANNNLMASIYEISYLFDSNSNINVANAIKEFNSIRDEFFIIRDSVYRDICSSPSDQERVASKWNDFTEQNLSPVNKKYFESIRNLVSLVKSQL